MNELDDNFLNDEYEDDALDEAINPASEQDDFISEKLREAQQRTDMLKALGALMNADLFAKGSIDAEVSTKIVKALRLVMLLMINNLVGVKSDSKLIAQVLSNLGIDRQIATANVANPFNDAQVVALRSIADRLIATKPAGIVSSPSPTVNTVGIQSSSVNAVEPEGLLSPSPRPQQKKPRTRRPKSENVSQVAIQRGDGSVEKIDVDYSQAVATARPPLKMPTQPQMDMMNAQTADLNSRAPLAGTGSTAGGSFQSLVTTLLQNAQKR